MKFAHFSHVWGKPNMTAHQRYEQLWRELEFCGGLGCEYSFCVEHHFRPDESWMSSPALYAVAGGARTKRLRVGAMGFVVPLHNPLRLAEEIAIVDQMLGGRFECGLVPGISPGYFTPFGIDYNFRKSPTFEFVHYLRAAYGDKQPFAFHGDNHNTDSALLAFHPALFRASRAYEGLLPLGAQGETFEDRVAKQLARFTARGEPGAGQIMSNIFNQDYIMENELVFVGSVETVTKKLRNAAEVGFFNTFMGEFNFANLPEADLMRSIRLFGEKVMPALRDYEPF